MGNTYKAAKTNDFIVFSFATIQVEVVLSKYNIKKKQQYGKFYSILLTLPHCEKSTVEWVPVDRAANCPEPFLWA